MSEPVELRQSGQIVMLGAHDSGKTTFLGALWAILGEDRNQSKLGVSLSGKLPRSTAYLDAAKHALLGGETVGRTARDSGETVELELVSERGPLSLTQFDISGETVDNAFRKRTVPDDLIKIVAASDAVMVFINPNDVLLPGTLQDAQNLIAAAGMSVPAVEQPFSQPPSDAQVSDEEIWNGAPTCVLLVDLIQTLRTWRGVQNPLRVAIIISRWDTIDTDVANGKTSISPEDWLDRTLPLLSQYLSMNSPESPFEVFGVSAQGGDYHKPEVADELALIPMSNRVRVVWGEAVSNDLSHPLRWLVGHV